MSIYIQQQPDTIQPANNYIWCEMDPASVAGSGPVFSGLTNYYVQFELYNYDTNQVILKNNVKVYDGIWRGFAVFDMHRVLQNYVSFDYRPSTIGFADSTYAFYSYGLNVYEYTGATLLSACTNAFGHASYVFNGARPKNETWDQHDYYLMSSAGDFLSDWEGPRYYREQDMNLLAFFDRDAGAGYNIKWARIKLYKDGAPVTFASGGTSLFVQSSTGSTPATTNERYRYFGCGPYNINWTGMYDSFGNLFYNIIDIYEPDYYTILFENDMHAVMSETITCYIERDCVKIEEVSLHWLNKLGGWETYCFFGEVHQFSDIKRETYRRIDYSQGGSYNMSVAQKTRGTQILNLDVIDRWSVVSKVLNDTMSKNLSTIFESPEVYWNVNTYDGKTWNLETRPIAIIDESVEVQRNRNGRAIYKFDFELSAMKTTQIN